MRRFFLIAAFLSLSVPCWAQGILLPVMQQQPSSAPAATPGFVSAFSAMPVNVTTNPAGQSACSSDAICPNYVEPLLAGNLGVVEIQYTAASAATITATDDASPSSDTYTCANISGAVSGSQRLAYCYTLNATSGAHKVTVAFSAAANSVSAWPMSFYNIGTSAALDATAGCSGASGTTANCASVTTTAANDLVIQLVGRVATPAVTDFSSYSGTVGTKDILFGLTDQFQVAASAGSVTPSVTMASASTYLAGVLAFKSANAGTQPTSSIYPYGWVQRIESSNITSGTSLAIAAPSSGNFLVMESPCGGGLVPSSVSGTNTWTVAPGQVSPWSRILTSKNASSDLDGAMTITFTGTGDCTVKTYDVTGAPSTQILSHAAYYQNAGNKADPATLWSNSAGTPLGSLQDVMNTLATPTRGLIFADSSVAFNTINGVNAPSGCIFDALTWGGEALDGPTASLPGDENNGFMHCSIGSLQSSHLQFSVADTSEVGTGQSIWSDEVGLYTTGAYALMNYSEGRRTTAGTSLVLTVPSTTSGYTAVVDTAQYNGTNISSVAFTNGTGGTSAFTKCTSCAVSSGTNRTSVWVNANEPAGATSVTITASASSAQLDGAFFELNGLSTQDAGGAVNAGTGNSSTACSGSGTFDCGASVTTTGTTDLVNAPFNSTNTISACPASGNEFSWYFVTWAAGGEGGACGLITQTAAAHRPIATDAGSGATFGASTEAYKP